MTRHDLSTLQDQLDEAASLLEATIRLTSSDDAVQSVAGQCSAVLSGARDRVAELRGEL